MANYNNYRQQTTNGGWGLIIIAFIVFWPVGVFLLCRKLASDRVARLNDGKALIIIGGIMLAYGALRLIEGGYYYARFAATSMIFYLGGGAALLYLGLNMRKTSARYRKYITIIANQGISDIETIAGMVGNTTPQQRQMDLQKMIDKGYFHDAYIDQGAGRIVLATRQPVQQVPAFAASAPGGAPQPMAGPRVVSCPGCGANNTVVGNTAECEYCGGPLS